MIAVAIVLAVTVASAIMPATHGQTVEELKAEVSDLKNIVGNLARQTMNQQFAVEERTRTDGDSGVKVARSTNNGPQNYYVISHTGSAYCSIHDHSNYARTIGMGEIVVVLNGVEFQTRHNDYKLMMPSPNSTDYHASVPIPFPDVPEEVTDITDIGDQIEEMTKWFKAFKDQDHSVRDYRKHFKPVLCYLEGTWTLDKELEEPFESDRHHLDASSWFELQENVRYTSYTGTKNRLENFAYLPTTIMSVNATTGLPNYAQWNYRIVCSPIKEDIPTKYFKKMDDLAVRFPRQISKAESFYHRSARFRLYESEQNRFTKYTLIDQIFSQIPGMDNVPGELRQDSFGESMLKFDEDNVELNTGFYHRWFKFTKPGAMGLTTVSRGFNDENLWVAQTTQKRVAPMALEVCKKNGACQAFEHRFSFAIPLEIIYLTPLLSWNPFDIEIHSELGIATAKGKNGNEDKPLDGADEEHHYITPAAFFSGSTDMSDPADTVKNSNYVLDKHGNKRVTVASGTRIIQQELPGVGQVRLRYPIAPVHGEGSSVWKELNAVRDFLYELQASGIGRGGGGGGGNNAEEDSLPEFIEFAMTQTNKSPSHFHTFNISRADYLDMRSGEGLQIRVTTSKDAGHTHDLTIRFHYKRGFEYMFCDNEKQCADKHPRKVYEIRDAAT